MKKIFLSFLTVGFLFACGGDESADETSNESTEESSEEAEVVPEVEVDITLVKTEDVPEACTSSGKTIDAYTWSDLNGVNYFIRTMGELEEHPENEAGYATASRYLYAYHWVKAADGTFELKKETTDFVKDCEFDLNMSHELDAISLTDLDEDQIGEISFIYRLTCTSDVSPSTQKLIMLEDGNKYPLRGTTQVMGFGGEYEVGDEFDSAPEGFLDHAKELWSQHLAEYDFEL